MKLPIDRAKGLAKDFQAFALKGNIIDLAVGVIIGSAFGKIVTSLVSDIFMPLIGRLTGGINVSGAFFCAGWAGVSIAGRGTGGGCARA